MFKLPDSDPDGEISAQPCFFKPAEPRGITSREVYRDFQPSLTSSAGGAKGCSDHRFRAPPAYTVAQLPTLHQHRANKQYRHGLRLDLKNKTFF